MKDLCEELRDHLGEIIDDWEGVAAEEPWLSLPQGYGLDHVPSVAMALFEAAICAPKRQDAQHQLIHNAAKHGEDRRAQKFGQDNVLVEYQLLRAAIDRFLRRVAGPTQAAQAILQVDAAISIATRASLFGYHRPELEEVGRWPGVLDQLITASPLVVVGETNADVRADDSSARRRSRS